MSRSECTTQSLRHAAPASVQRADARIWIAPSAHCRLTPVAGGRKLTFGFWRAPPSANNRSNCEQIPLATGYIDRWNERDHQVLDGPPRKTAPDSRPANSIAVAKASGIRVIAIAKKRARHTAAQNDRREKIRIGESFRALTAVIAGRNSYRQRSHVLKPSCIARPGATGHRTPACNRGPDGSSPHFGS
jgi:hypothetical protein